MMDHVSTWVDICEVQRIAPFSGVAAMVNGEQVAIFRLTSDEEVYAISNYDPFSQAFVLSRGIVGDKQGILKVASPIYKHNFNLRTGECLDDPRVKLPIYPAQVIGGRVQVGLV